MSKVFLVNLNFRSVFARLYISVFLTLVVFAICMFGLTQIVHNNSDASKHRAIARQVASQVDPYLGSIIRQEGLVKTRFSLVIVKKSLDIFDESLNAKIGLYNSDKRLVVQTNDSHLPPMLTHEPTWLEDSLPSIFGTSLNHVLIKMPSGYTLWYESRTPPKAPSWSPFFNLFTGTVLMLILMAFVLWIIARSITERLDEMSKKMVQLGDGDFSVRVNADGNDEIADLAYGFNQAAQKIEQLLNANSLLLAHASHEFRTPITRIRLQIEMMDMISEYLSDNQRAKFKKRAIAINHDLTSLNELIESILLVSRLDAGYALEEMDGLDLYDLVAQECHLFKEQNQVISLYGESVWLHAQPKLITHLVRNLINNAFIHGIPPVSVYVYGCQSREGSYHIPSELLLPAQPAPITPAEQISINSADQESAWNNTKGLPEYSTFGIRAVDPKTFHNFDDDRSEKSFFERFKKPTRQPNNANFAVLCVIDQGLGIAMDKREDIFSPFVRLKQEKKGSGLGLSLVAQIAEAHGGRIITDTWQGNTRFLAVLPIRTPSNKKYTKK